MKTHFLIPVLAAILVISCTPRRPGNINAEQVHNPAAQQLISPGFGTMGVIHNGILDIYYQDDQAAWHVDGMSQFIIPEGNEGVIAMGLGIFGVVINSSCISIALTTRTNGRKKNTCALTFPAGTTGSPPCACPGR